MDAGRLFSTPLLIRRQSPGVGERESESFFSFLALRGASMGYDAAWRMPDAPETRRSSLLGAATTASFGVGLPASRSVTPKRRNLWPLKPAPSWRERSSSKLKEGERFSPVKLLRDREGR